MPQITDWKLFEKMITLRDLLDAAPVPTEGRHIWPPLGSKVPLTYFYPGSRPRKGNGDGRT